MSEQRDAEFYWKQNENVGDFRSILTHHRKNVKKSEDGRYHLTYSLMNAVNANVNFALSYCEALYAELYLEFEEVQDQNTPVALREMSYTSYESFIDSGMTLFGSSKLLDSSILLKSLEPTYSYSPEFLDFGPWMQFNNFTRNDFAHNETYVCEQYVRWISSNNVNLYRMYNTQDKCVVYKTFQGEDLNSDILMRLEDTRSLVNGSVFDNIRNLYRNSFRVVEDSSFLTFDETDNLGTADISIYVFSDSKACANSCQITALNNFAPSEDLGVLVNNKVTLLTAIGTLDCGGIDYSRTAESVILHAVGHAVGLTHIRDTYFNEDRLFLLEKYDNCSSLMSYEEEPSCHGLTGLDEAALGYLYP